MSAHGFVYFLENPSMRGLFKIGFTKNHPKLRAQELSQRTSCPTPFRVLAYFGCYDASGIEADIHADLAQYRVNGNREFFKLTYAKMLEVFNQHADELSDACYRPRLEYFADLEARGEVTV